MMSKKEAKNFVDHFKQSILFFLEKDLVLKFSDHSFEVHLLEVSLAFAYETKTLIDQRESDGKSYTPHSIKMSFKEGNLFFVIEDIGNYSIGINNFIIEMQKGLLIEWRLLNDTTK